MHATKLLKPLVATALAVVAFGATATVAQAADYTKRPHEPMPAVAADYPPGPTAADLPPGPGATDLPPGPGAADLPPGPTSDAVGPEY